MKGGNILRLISLHVENFGKLSGLDLKFQDGLNAYLRENGTGKSTLAAFIRVMFYGFSNDRKRDETENERMRYTPWQGGVYGGQLVFETKGKTYRIERVFEKKNDSFMLYDETTNLPSTDFGENIGEALFRIDRESFTKTVFIGQQDVVTAPTDSISAKIGGINETGDLMSYDRAIVTLTDEANALSPRRATGEVKKLQNRLAELDAELQKKDDIEEALDKTNAEMEMLRAELVKAQEERKQKSALRDALTAYQAVLTEKNSYAALQEEKDKAEKRYKEERDAFSGEVPTEAELEPLIKDAGHMVAIEDSLSKNQLTPELEKRLSHLEKEFSTGIPDQAELGAEKEKAEKLRQLRTNMLAEALTDEEKEALDGFRRMYPDGMPSEEEISVGISAWQERQGIESALPARRAGFEQMKLSQEESERRRIEDERRRQEEEKRRQEEEARRQEAEALRQREEAARLLEAERKAQQPLLIEGIFLLILAVILFAVTGNRFMLALLIPGAALLFVYAKKRSSTSKAEQDRDMSSRSNRSDVHDSMTPVRGGVSATNDSMSTVEENRSSTQEVSHVQNPSIYSPGLLKVGEEIERDARRSAEILQQMEAFFQKLNMPWQENEVLNTLYRLQQDSARFIKLSDKEKLYRSKAYEERTDALIKDLTDFFARFGLLFEEAHMLEDIIALREDSEKYQTLLSRRKDAEAAEKELSRVHSEKEAFLKKYQLSEDADLTAVRDHVLSLKPLKEALEQRSDALRVFTDAHDVKRFENVQKPETEEDIDSLSTALSALEKDITEKGQTLREYEKRAEEYTDKFEAITEISAERENLQETSEEKKRLFDVISLTEKYLTAAKDNFLKHYMAPMQAAFDQYYALLTGAKDPDFVLDAKLSVTKTELGKQRNVKLLSAGYQDLVGLCHRMAMVDAMYEEEKPFLLFDDSFVNLDQEKMTDALKFLSAISKEYQVLYFTCHDSRMM